MIREVVQNSGLEIFQIISLVIFCGWFTGVFFWIYRSRSADLYSKLAELPLKEGPQERT